MVSVSRAYTQHDGHSYHHNHDQQPRLETSARKLLVDQVEGVAKDGRGERLKRRDRQQEQRKRQKLLEESQHDGQMAVLSAPKPLVVDIVVHSDTLCPWCYIEKRSLESAMDKFMTRHPQARFNVIWKPFYLNPHLKARCGKRCLYDEWSGGTEKFDEHLERVKAAGSKYKIAFSITGRTGCSRNAHRLIALALSRGGPSTQSRVVEALFKGHFEDGRDIADDEWLIKIGHDAGGIPSHVIAAHLADESSGRAVDREAEDATDKMGVEAVPCVTVQGRYMVGGFQEEIVFEKLFEKLRAGQES